MTSENEISRMSGLSAGTTFFSMLYEIKTRYYDQKIKNYIEFYFEYLI